MADNPKIILTLPTGEVRKYSLQMDSVRIGRAADNTVVLEDPSLSSHHAVLHRRDESFEILDLGSTNGLEIAGRKVFQHNLTHGDEIKIGEVILRYEVPGMPLPEAAETTPGEAATESIGSADSPPGEGGVDQPAPAKQPAPSQPAGDEPKGGCLAAILLFALTIAAPVAGLHARHLVETSGILVMDVLNHRAAGQVATPPAAPAPAEPAP
jgi:predicted component of type VI protein secretion system